MAASRRTRLYPSFLQTSCRALCTGVIIAAAPVQLLADEQTRVVQEELRRRNLYFGDISGQPTPETVAAVREYQHRKGFEATGHLDHATVESLRLPPSGLPDEPVLRSDIALTKNERMALARASNPPATEEQQTATSEERLEPVAQFVQKAPRNTKKQQQSRRAPAQTFVDRFLQDSQKNAPGRESQYYADRVDYLHHGIVSRKFVERNIRAYQERWPSRSYRLLDLASYQSKANGDLTIKFRTGFTLAAKNKVARGETINSITLRSIGGSLQIVAVREQRVRPGKRPSFLCRLFRCD